MAILFSAGRFKATDKGNAPVSGAFLSFYATQTSTFQPIYADSALTTVLTNPVKADANGLFPEIWLDDALPPYKVIFSSPDINDASVPGSVIWTIPQYNNVVDPAAFVDTLFPFLYPRTNAEINAEITPVNFAYAPGYPERYGTNTTPGTTSMTAAVQAAINVVKKGGAGGVVSIGSSGPYFIDGALDLTTPTNQNYTGFTFRGVGNANPATSSPSAVISLVHNTIAFDCTGSLGITFENLTIQAFNATYPTIGFLLARNTNARSQTMRFNNVQVLGSFSKALIYNFGSENDQYTACSFYNRAADANSCTMYFTSSNILGIASAFTTIAPGSPSQSTIDHKIIGGEIAHQGGLNTNDVIRLDAVSNVKILGPWMLCASGSASGRSLIYMHTVNGPTNLVTMLGVEGESATFVGSYGIFFDGVAGVIPSYWVIESCTMPNVTAFLTANANTTCDNFHVKAVSNQGIGGGLAISKLQNSHIDELGLSGTAFQIGTSQNNIYNCNAASIAITTPLGGDNWSCVGLGTWTPVTSALTHGGTLTVTHPNYQRQAGETAVTVTLSDTVSLSCAAGTLLGGLPFAPLANGTVIVINQAVPSLIGAGTLNGTSIVLPAISVGAGVAVTITARYFNN
jgi:hypothetical protein